MLRVLESIIFSKMFSEGVKNNQIVNQAIYSIYKLRNTVIRK